MKRFSSFFIQVLDCYSSVCQHICSLNEAYREQIARSILFLFGVSLLTFGLQADSFALATTYNSSRVSSSVNAILTYIEGSFGALVMVSAGIGAILSSAFGQYRASLGLLVVAVGSFILRSVLSTFFNDQEIRS